MKNVHLLPTDNKPSRLYFNINDKEFQICEIEKPSTILKPNRHAYITNDEEINQQTEPCWCINTIKNTWNKDLIYYQGAMPQYHFVGFKKIILTTDQDLIKDGVQSIDDEFLEWFVKNPSCEEVDIDAHVQSTENGHILYYQIIIPKKEPKQDKIMERFIANAKQETLEEVAIRFYKESKLGNVTQSFIEGAKWQQERSYSEEEVRNIANWAFGFYKRNDLSDSELEDEFNRILVEKFKKK